MKTTAKAVVFIFTFIFHFHFVRGANRKRGAHSVAGAALPGVAVLYRTRLRTQRVRPVVRRAGRQPRRRHRRLPHGWLAQRRQFFVLGETATVEPSLVVALDPVEPVGARGGNRAAHRRQGTAAAPARQRQPGREKRRMVSGETLTRAQRIEVGQFSAWGVKVIVHGRILFSG